MERRRDRTGTGSTGASAGATMTAERIEAFTKAPGGAGTNDGDRPNRNR